MANSLLNENIFSNIKILPAYGFNSCVISWHLNPRYVLSNSVALSYFVNVQKSRDGYTDWFNANISPIDPLQSSFVDKHFINKNQRFNWHYRLVLMNGNNTVYCTQPIGIFHTLDQGEFSTLRSMIENEILQKDSVNCLLLRPKGLSGQKYMDLNQDTPNYDQITGEQIGVSTDTSAYGEIFKSGFSLPILIQISLDAIATQHVDNSQGQGSDIHRIVSISGCSYPMPMRGDMIVITETDERYFFDQITSESLFKGLFPFTYKGTMRLIPRNQVQYKIPLRDLKACCCCLVEGDSNSCQQI